MLVREGDWKLINKLGSGGFSKPNHRTPEPDGPKGQLYNMKDDPGEQTNLYLKHPEVVERLEKQLTTIRDQGHQR